MTNEHSLVLYVPDQCADYRDGEPSRETNINSPFLNLPPDLRNIVYDFVLDEGVFDVFPDRHSPRPQALSMMSTCREIRYEALPLFYSRNTLDFTLIVSHIPGFVRIVSSVVRNAIRSIRIDYYDTELLVSALRRGVPRYLLRMLPALNEVIVTSNGFSNRLRVAATAAIRTSACKADVVVRFEIVPRWQRIRS